MKTAPLASLFVALNALDATATAYLTTHGAQEANPIMAAVLSLGVGSFVTFKVSAATLVAAVLARSRPWSLRAVCVAFAGIVAWQMTLCVTL
jgi:hypothetical protein